MLYVPIIAMRAEQCCDSCALGLQKVVKPPMACRALNGGLGGWYMRGYSNNLLFIVVLLTSLKVTQTCDCSLRFQSKLPCMALDRCCLGLRKM